MAQLKDTLINGSLRATNSIASPIGQFDTIYAKEENTTGVTENYTSGADKKILQSGTFDNEKVTYWASLSPIIDLTDGTVNEGPKIGATIAGVSTLINNRTELNKANVNVYGVTKLTSDYDEDNLTLAANGRALQKALQTLDSNIPNATNANIDNPAISKTLMGLSITDGKISAATFTDIAINSNQITSGINRNTILYGNAEGAIGSIAPEWKAWVAGTTAGPQAKIQIGNIDYTSAAIPSASTTASGVITTGDQSFSGIKTFIAQYLNLTPSTSEGGEIHLNASSANSSQAGIVLDQRESTFRIFGIASADGSTITGTGTPLVIDPYAKTITGGYTLTGSLTGHASLDLPLTGGIVTGYISMKTSYNASLANNGISSGIGYPTTFNILDSAERIMVRKEAVINSNGSIGSYWYVRNYNTEGTLVAQKGIGMYMAKDGTLTYGVSDPDKFRSALGLGTVATYDVIGTANTNGFSSTKILIPRILTDGVMEVGKYIDFHANADSTNDYDVRITANTTGLTISGTTSGTFSGSLNGNASTATRINGNLGQISSDTNCNIWVSSTSSADGIPKYVSGVYVNASTGRMYAKEFRTSHGYINGSATNGGINMILTGDDAWIGDCNIAGTVGIKANAGATAGVGFYGADGTNRGRIYYDANGGHSTTTFEATGYLKSTANSNTITIGSQNNSWTHIYSSANIPFIFNNRVCTTAGGLGNSDYAWSDLWLKGSINYKGTAGNYTPISFKDSGDQYGLGVIVGAGGLTCIGGGESAPNVAASISSGGSEQLCLSGDNGIDFYVNCQNGMSSAVHTSISATGTYIHEDSGVSYIAGAKGDHAALYAKKAYNQDHWYPAVALETKGGGSWQIGNYNNENLQFVYATKANRDSSTNTVSILSLEAANGTIITSANYTSYTVTKTGSGASGTWGINVTGSSASCTGHASSDLALSGGTMTGDLLFANSGTTIRQIRGIVGDNDYWRIAGGATAANAGWMEIATADDGNEPIYVRQYTGVYATITRTLTLLDASGNTTFPGSLYLNNKGTNIIYNGPNDTTNGVGGALNNLVFSSWYGVSFTTSCTGQTYTNTNAVSINCRNGNVYAARFNGPLTGNVTGNCSGSSGSCTGNAATATKLGTATVGSSLRPIYLNGGTATAVSWYPSYCTINGGNTANYPWHRFATCTTGTGQYVDKSVIVVFHARCNGGRYGAVKLGVRTNASGAAMASSAVWLYRYGFNAGDIIITSGGTTGTDTRFNAWVKCGTWPRTIAYILEGSNNGWSLINSNEPDNCTAASQGTEINASVSGNVATDGATVSYAMNAGSASNVTGTVAIGNGGTGATTAVGARRALGFRAGAFTFGTFTSAATTKSQTIKFTDSGAPNLDAPPTAVVATIRDNSYNKAKAMWVTTSNFEATGFILHLHSTITTTTNTIVTWIAIA